MKVKVYTASLRETFKNSNTQELAKSEMLKTPLFTKESDLNDVSIDISE